MKTSWFALFASAEAVILPRDGPQAVYFLDNDPSGASIVALKVSPDGSLSDPVRTLTGGLGRFGLNSTGGEPGSGS